MNGTMERKVGSIVAGGLTSGRIDMWKNARSVQTILKRRRTIWKGGKPKMGNELTASLNYEAEYHKLLQEKEILMAKMEFLRSENNSLETELVRLRAQMDVVYLIFGGK